MNAWDVLISFGHDNRGILHKNYTGTLGLHEDIGIRGIPYIVSKVDIFSRLSPIMGSTITSLHDASNLFAPPEPRLSQGNPPPRDIDGIV